MLVALAVFAAAPATAAVTGATAGPDGWWSSTPAGPPVPPTGLAVAASGGEPSRVAAVGVVLNVDPGATLERLELVLVEHGDSGSNLSLSTPPGAPAPVPTNPATPAIVACPATSPIVPARGGAIASAPKYDCSLARAEGARGSNGTWVFDITAIARLWLGSLAQQGVVLVEAAGPPGSFQTTFRDVASGGVRLDLTATIAEPDEPPTESFTSFGGDGAAGDPVTFAPFDDPRLGDVGFAEPAPLAAAPTAPPETPVASRPQAAAPLVGAANGRVAGNLPPMTVLLVPIVLLAAGLLAYVLGPNGDPAVASTRRVGAVSRALAGRADPRTTENS